MKPNEILAIAVVVAALLLGLSPEAGAGGAGDPLATCVVHSPQGLSLTGHVELTVHFTGTTTADPVEVTLALQREKAGTPEFFRRIITGTVQVLSPQGMACYVISHLRSEVLTRFFGSDSGETISIADDSISESDGLGPLDPNSPSLQTSLAKVRVFIR